MTGSIRAFVANQVNVAISRFLGLKCASNILKFDSNMPPQMCLLKCASSMQVLLIDIHGSHSDDLYWIHALCREISLVVITRFGRHFWPKLVGGGTNILEDRGLLLPVLVGDLMTASCCTKPQYAN